MLRLDDIFTTQHGLRDPEQLPEMVEFVRRGGVFDSQAIKEFCEPRGVQCSLKIYLTRFPDGQIYFHDGHHRAYSIWLGGRTWLDPNEFTLRDFKYEDYLQPNVKLGFVTPFDPRTEVRRADFLKYKEETLALLGDFEQSGIYGEELARIAAQIAAARAAEYKQPRVFRHISSILVSIPIPIIGTGAAKCQASQ